MGKKISFVGSGNVAWNLARAFDLAGHTISQVVSRDIEHAKSLASKYGAYYGNDFSGLYNDADFVLISVHDDAYEDVVSKLPGLKGIVCHTSGATDLEVFNETGYKAGVFYPLQSFNKDHYIDLMSTPILIESNEVSTEKELYALADSISNKVSVVSSDDRLRYHLAAVFANNFTNFMYICAERFLESGSLDFDLLKPIILETAQRLKNDKASYLQTGPAKRGDKEVIDRHLSLIEDADLRKIYEIISQSIMTLS